jgi:hypothetical protein
MERFSPEQIEEKNKLVADLLSKQTSLQKAIEKFNEQVSNLFDEIITPAVEAYNDSVNEHRSTLENWHSEASDYFDEHADDWDEERAEIYSFWVDKLYDAYGEVDEISIDAPENLEVDDFCEFEALKNIPDKPSIE